MSAWRVIWARCACLIILVFCWGFAAAQVSVSVSPRVTSVTFTQSQQFAATVSGTANTAVTWSVDGIVGGNTTVGTVTAAGLYQPPKATGSHAVTATSAANTTVSATAKLIVTNYAGLFTYHNNNSRTGTNQSEIVLTPGNVNYSQFGRRFSYALDGRVYGQPLYVANLSIPNKGYHNVVYVATENDSVYAFDADGRSSTWLWKRNFTNPGAGITAIPCSDVTGCAIGSLVGITSTPVIDTANNVIYVVARTKENGSYVQRLRALDLTTGADKFGGAVTIQASVSGTGDGGQNGIVGFDSIRENNRPALLLLNGKIYVAFASLDDTDPYHGWILGYAPDPVANVINLVAALNTTPNGSEGGIWGVGALAANDGNGNIFCATGNGSFNTTKGSYGDSVLKLTTSGGVLQVADYFTPYNQATLATYDQDFGSGSPLLLPYQSNSLHPYLMLIGGKQGRLYLLDRTNLGKFNSSADNVLQVLSNLGGFYTSPAYWNGRVFFGSTGHPVKLFTMSNGLLATPAKSQTSVSYPFPGGNPVVSANGSINGIVWVLQRVSSSSGALRAYNATNLAQELYNSNQAGSRDAITEPAKFTSATVANGKVYFTANNAAGAQATLQIFGLLP